MSTTQKPDQRPIRPAAVAGQFYPADPDELKAEVSRYLDEAAVPEGSTPKAIIVPHAGYMFSGPIAGAAYAWLRRGQAVIRRVVLLGPSHHVAVRGLAASTAGAFATPLGLVPVDEEALVLVGRLPQVVTMDAAHRREHSLEVQLPFLQTIFPQFTLVPLVVGDATAAEVAEVLNALWAGPETCLVISSDLSHYHDYRAAQQMDRASAHAIETLQGEDLHGDQACGCRPICGLLQAAKEHGLSCRTVDLRNSGDTAGPRDRVVGYGSFIFAEK